MVENIAALTIAGSDCGAGAGIQADLKTFSALGVYGTTVITAVTAQNLRGVTAIQAIDPLVVEKQLLAVLEGFPVKAIKTGMLFSGEIIETVTAVLKRFPNIPLVIDPVLTATSGKELLQKEAVETLKAKLFTLAVLITPNITEAEILGDIHIKLKSKGDLEKAAKELFKRFNVAVLLKGGHLPDSASDVLCDQNGIETFQSDSINGVNSHGSGCTFSAAVTAFLARGLDLKEAISAAKDYITGSLKNPHRLAEDTQVINHFWK